MDSKGQFGLTYTDDFSIACAINNLKPVDLLQYLINRASFYAFNGGEMEAVTLMATKVIVDCNSDSNAEVLAVSNRKEQFVSLKYIGLLSDLNFKDDLSAVAKMKEGFYLMKEWENELISIVDYPKTYEIDETHFLILTFDFNLLCRVNGVSQQQVLQYFINQISLPKDRAENIPVQEKTNAGMALFQLFLLSRSMKVNSVLQDIHEWHSERLLSLDERLKKEGNIEKRISIYRAFYAEWYQTLKKNMS